MYRKPLFAMLVASILMLSFTFSSCKKNEEEASGEWVVKINNKTYYKSQLDDEYYFFWQSLGLDKKDLEELKKNPERQKGLDPQLKNFLYEFKYLDKFVQNALVYQKAKDSGFLDRPDVKRKLRVAMKMLAIDMYLRDQLKDKVKVTDQEVQQFIEDQQKRDPRFGVGTDYETLVKKVRDYLLKMKLMKEGEKLMKELVEESKIERNKKVLKELEKMETQTSSREKEKNKDTANKTEGKK